MDWFKLGYTLLGGLGVFFLGMTQLSESLQSIAGNFIKSAINWLTTNRLTAVLVGLSITMIIQSSSVTTVMVVGFVNAGLMNLTQAIGIIFGSNIGTTITGWIIAIKVGKYGLLLIGLGIFPMIFAKNNFWKNSGKLLVSLGLVFFGLQLMSTAFKPLRTHEGFLSILSYFSADSIPSLLGCVFVGSLLTAIIQSSSAMLGITIAMAMTGVLTFQTSAALVLGQNIGTTITAYLASVTGNINAKRTARAHIIFNIAGALIIIILFSPYVKFIEYIIAGSADYTSQDGSKPYIATHIAAAHTIFNIAITILFLPFVNHLAKLVTMLTPGKVKDKDSIYKLSLLGTGITMSPELAVEQAYLEVKKISLLVKETLEHTKNYLLADTPLKEEEKQVLKYEDITDDVQRDVYIFLTKVLGRKSMPDHLSQRANAIIRVSDELESVADYCESLIQYRKRFFENKDPIPPNRLNDLSEFIDDTIGFYDYSIKALIEPGNFSKQDCKLTYVALNKRADQIREQHLLMSAESAEGGDYNPITALTFSDMVVALRRIKNHTLNLAEALTGGKMIR